MESRAHLDVVHSDPLVIQQEPKLLLIDTLERPLEVLLTFPLATALVRAGSHHQRGIRSLEAHIQHPLHAYALVLKALLLELRPHLAFQHIEAGEKERLSIRLESAGGRLLTLESPR